MFKLVVKVLPAVPLEVELIVIERQNSSYADAVPKGDVGNQPISSLRQHAPDNLELSRLENALDPVLKRSRVVRETTMPRDCQSGAHCGPPIDGAFR
jgi:hypothetical protein